MCQNFHLNYSEAIATHFDILQLIENQLEIKGKKFYDFVSFCCPISQVEAVWGKKKPPPENREEAIPKTDLSFLLLRRSLVSYLLWKA
jgi:hypothetical protein